MSARERVLKALDHEIPDRVPIDLGGNQTGIHKFAYRSLSSSWASPTKSASWTPCSSLAQPCEAVLERFHVDTRYVCRRGAGEFEAASPRTAATAGSGTT